jgi:hypothetical protein
MESTGFLANQRYNNIYYKFLIFDGKQHPAANKLSLVDSDVDSYLNIRICQKEPKRA